MSFGLLTPKDFIFLQISFSHSKPSFLSPLVYLLPKTLFFFRFPSAIVIHHVYVLWFTYSQRLYFLQISFSHSKHHVYVLWFTYSQRLYFLQISFSHSKPSCLCPLVYLLTKTLFFQISFSHSKHHVYVLWFTYS